MAPLINLITSPPSPKLHYPRKRYSRRPYTLAFLIVILLLFMYLLRQSHSPYQNHGAVLQSVKWNATRQQSDIRIAKATFAYSPSNSIQNSSLTLHAAQGYETHVLRTPIVRGFANTFLWLQHIMVKEMIKKEEERVEWMLIFYSFILPSNPNITLHTFLPPLTSSNFRSLSIIGTKPNSMEMSGSLFFIRISPLSLRILTLAMASVYTDSELHWGDDLVGASLQYVLEKEEYKDKVIWQPKEWYNGTDAVFMQPRGGNHVQRLLKMEALLQTGNAQNAREAYPNADEVKVFWDTVTEAKQVLSEAKDRGHTSEEGDFADGVRRLKESVEVQSWDVPGMRDRLEELKEQLGIGEMIGFEMTIG